MSTLNRAISQGLQTDRVPQEIAFLSPVRRIGGLTFDAILSEDHRSDYEVTQFPVEDGSIISDHFIRRPRTLTVEGAVSDLILSDPTKLPASRSYGAAESGTAIGRSSAAFRALEDLQSRGELFDVQTGLKLYRNMLMTSFSTTTTAESAYAMAFTATLQEVVTTSVSVIQVEPGKTERRAKKPQVKGIVQAKPVTPVTADTPTTPTPDQSLALKLLNMIEKLTNPSGAK